MLRRSAARATNIARAINMEQITKDENQSNNESTLTTNPPEQSCDEQETPVSSVDISSESTNTTEPTMSDKQHNTDEKEQASPAYTCKICFKMLSSNSSLDRHVLVHSGERPFRCRVCAVTFNTNGNMHRHMRTHDSSGESDASTDSNQQQRLENNNNRVSIKRKYEEQNELIDDGAVTKHRCRILDDSLSCVCPICDKEEFPSLLLLEQHMDTFHPHYEMECGSCDVSFRNFRALRQHRYARHKEKIEEKSIKSKAVVGFSDLTFVDFSAEKFPQIARAACERNVHTPSNGCASFQCSRCALAFPCRSALEIHEGSCKSLTDCSKITKERSVSMEDIKREDFFATLNLQNKTAAQTKLEDRVDRDHMKRVTTNNQDNRDLADIQSIISMASAKALLKQLSSKPPDTAMAQDCIKESQGEEEAQDVFSAEFRKMKLRGEFPCRLCTAIFPNLRALKGHNRLHLTGNGPGPYRCNMCPHSSTDKAALVRHMRTHNGDRPYECAICNYAFTTKANCERHLRNRHAKVTREEVKRSIVYHPSEDPNNDDLKREQATHAVIPQSSSVFGTPETDPESMQECIPNDRSTPVSHLTHQRPSLNLALPHDLSIVIPQCNLATRILETSHRDIEMPPAQKIHVKSLEQLSSMPQVAESEDDSEEEEHRPIDLSMDALDLSKKSTRIAEKTEPATSATNNSRDSTKNSLDFINEQAANAMLQMAQQQHRFKGNIAPAAANFYATQLQQWYSNGFPLPPSAFSPFFLPPPSSHPFLTPPSNAQDVASMKELEKEIIRGLQLSGGSVIMNNMALASERLQAFHQQAFNLAVAAKGDKISLNDDTKNSLLVNTALAPNIEKSSPSYSPNTNSPKTVELSTPTSHSPGAVKMVIKNGVLMPKQKQRRYRTERPFSCEHCSARFTLRSNMERHVKQQHPQHWAQRQRSGGHIVRRGPVAHTNQGTEGHSQQINVDFINVSEHVKYAILAQQLQRSENLSSSREIDDEDVELVIDEDAQEEKPTIKDEFPTLANDNTKARRVADEILQQARFVEAAGIKEKDFDLKIVSNLIPKSPMDLSRSETMPVISVKNNIMKLDGKLAQALSSNTRKATTEQICAAQMKANKADEIDLVSVSKLIDNANSQLPFGRYFRNEQTSNIEESEGEEEGLVASGSASDGNNSGSDENRSESEQRNSREKKKSAYSLAPNRVSCNYCHRKFPWSSSLRRHILTHTGQKPYKCAHCPLLFTTKSNCDRHLLRKHGHLTQQVQANAPTPISSSIGLNVSPAVAKEEVNGFGFITRNVPERPYKCSSCPSSTFSTISNLKKHMSCKHSNTSSSTEQLSGSSRPSSPLSESASEQIPDTKEKDWESQIGSKGPGHLVDNHHPSNVQNSEFPFKCHLCEGSYPERNVALEHIKESHFEEYELLVSKGAMDTEQDSLQQGLIQQQQEENDDTHSEAGKGRFPDYANRKVICAFCMRRFWSAEDLRRHMRTHSGVRPFQCDVCRRRFTLKHSMLRHRKKHDTQARHSLRLRCNTASATATDSVSETSDEEAKLTGQVHQTTPEGDLIGNLLGISDKGILNKVLVSSAQEAAMLLGVDHRK